jgi:hypothetical protein
MYHFMRYSLLIAIPLILVSLVGLVPIVKTALATTSENNDLVILDDGKKKYKFGADYKVGFGDDNAKFFFKNNHAKESPNLILKEGSKITIHFKCGSDGCGNGGTFEGFSVYLVNQQENDKSFANEDAKIIKRIGDDDNRCDDDDKKCEFKFTVPNNIDENKKYKIVVEAGQDELNSYFINKVKKIE